MTMIEIYKDIPWYEWIYKSSNIWNIIIVNYRWTWKSKLKISTLRNWYPSVELWKDWNNKQFLVSRLMASSFMWLDLKDRWTFVCHKDDNPLNNTLDNFFLWTCKDNTQDCILKWRKVIITKKVSQFSKDWIFIKEWESLRSAAEALLIQRPNISNCLRWERPTAWWFIWKF